MKSRLHELLKLAERRNALPKVIAYNRIDGPGSSLDIHAFQQTLWTLPSMHTASCTDAALEWTRTLPRTVGITIDAGTVVQAEPFDEDWIAVRSVEYRAEAAGRPGEILLTRENWLLKIVELFGLKGVRFVLHNLRPGLQSSGLGGSATATTGLAILANELAGRPFSPVQLVAISSSMEHDLGVSITGTQEQSNVVFGGVTDYVWFPWGIPGRPDSGYGHSLRRELIPMSEYGQLECRIAVFHSGLTRHSTDVNSVWMAKLLNVEGYRLHRQKLEVAYRFREGLRQQQWEQVLDAVREYRAIRTELCAEYMNGASEIAGFAQALGCEAFPLGAGGGGSVAIFSPDSQRLESLRSELDGAYRAIPLKIKGRGHELVNVPLEGSSEE